MNNFTKSVTSKNALLTDKFSRIEIRFRTSMRRIQGHCSVYTCLYYEQGSDWSPQNQSILYRMSD